MMNRTRKAAYLTSAVAVMWFFFFPHPETAAVGALVLQTLAFIIVAGKYPADGLLLSGISFLLIGLLPSDHPFVNGSQAFEQARWVLITIGVATILAMGTLILYRMRR